MHNNMMKYQNLEIINICGHTEQMDGWKCEHQVCLPNYNQTYTRKL